MTIIELLQNGSELKYCLNQEAIGIAGQLGVALKYIQPLKQLQSGQEYQKQPFVELITKGIPGVKDRALVKILEASAIACYHKGLTHPVVKILLCDDAPQFKIITEELALCWVHDGRLYKKLSPVIPHHVKEQKQFLAVYWEYYRKLLAYKIAPSQETAFELSIDFDRLFSTKTGYQALDERIAKTKQKKASLLLALKYPEIPLHNNAAELAARTQVRKRDVSLHTITQEGTQANDTFLTITQTCKKLGLVRMNISLIVSVRRSNYPPWHKSFGKKPFLLSRDAFGTLIRIYHDFREGTKLVCCLPLFNLILLLLL